MTLPKIKGFNIPKWWECGWRRVACGKKSCVLCGRILGDRQKHIERGEDPDDMKSVLEDVGGSLSEALAMIKQDARRMGIDIANIDNIKEPPRPDKFALYRRVAKWRGIVSEIIARAEESQSLWLFTEVAADLMWYKNIVAAKTYRQLCNRWHIDHGDDYGEVDVVYTKYVLTECIRIMKKSLHELSLLASEQKAELMLAAGRLAKFESEILTI